MAILSFRFILVAFSAYFLRIEAKRALLSLFLEVLGNNSREADGEEADDKVSYSKDIGSGKVVSEKIRGFLADFALYIF